MDAHTRPQKQPIGATVTYMWKNDPTPLQGYISFVPYTEAEGNDSDPSGKLDDEIFFYSDGGEDDLKAMMNPEYGEDFVVVAWELEHVGAPIGAEA